VRFHKTVEFTRRELYPMSNLVTKRDTEFLNLMGPGFIHDTIEVK